MDLVPFSQTNGEHASSITIGNISKQTNKSTDLVKLSYREKGNFAVIA